MGLVAVVGNGLVLYLGFGNKNFGRLRYLDIVIKSLAVNDLLYAMIGFPYVLAYIWITAYDWAHGYPGNDLQTQSTQPVFLLLNRLTIIFIFSNKRKYTFI